MVEYINNETLTTISDIRQNEEEPIQLVARRDQRRRGFVAYLSRKIKVSKILILILDKQSK